MKREVISQALNHLDDRHIRDTAVFSPASVQRSPERMLPMKKRLLTFALAAALLLALGISAYAVWSMPRSTGTYLMPQDAEYTDLSALPKIEKDVGYPVTVPERFSNGYAFTRLRVGGEALFGENNEVLETYYSVRALYTNQERAELWLTLTPVLAVESFSELPAPIPNEQRRISDRVIPFPSMGRTL